MANKKIICTGCRRSYDNKIEYCPYCSAPNPLFKSDEAIKKESNEGLKALKRHKAPEKEEPQDEYDEDDLFEESETDTDEEYIEEYSSEEEPEGEESSEEYEEYSEGDENEQDSEDEEGDANYDEDEYDQEDDYDESDDEDSSGSVLSADSKRSPIDWTDEEKKEAPDLSKAYDENGGYNPNFDGYYNDTKAKIEGEIESLTAGKEKAILKVVLGIAAVIGVIVYLVLTLY